MKNLSKLFQQEKNIKLAQKLDPFLLKIYCRIIGRFYIKKTIDDRIKRVVKKIEASGISLKKRKVIDGICDHYYEKLLMGFKDYDYIINFLSRRLEFPSIEKERYLLVTAHYGGVEFLPLALALNHHSYAMLLRFKTKKLKESLIERSLRFNVVLIDAEEENAARKLLLESKKRSILTECDEFSKYKTADKYIYFLGNKLYLDKTLNIIHKRIKIDAKLILLSRNKNRYKAVIEDLNSKNISKEALIKLEKHIKRDIYQWYQLPNLP